LNNYPSDDFLDTLLNSELTEEFKEKLQSNEALYAFTLDEFKLPSLLIKVLKSMKKFEVCEFITTQTEKLRTNFSNELFDQHQAFKEGDKVSFLITLVDISKDEYFYQMTVASKLARVLKLKSVAG
jgi:hypothetical protein